MRMLAGALALMALSSPLLAESWTEIDRTPSAATSIDADSVGDSGRHVTFWLRRIFDTERRIGVFEGGLMSVANAQGVAHYVEMRSFVDIDCGARTFTNPYVKFYSRDGRKVSEAALPAEPMALTPGAIAAGAAMFCPRA